MEFHIDKGRWIKAILRITEAMDDILTDDHRGEVLQIFRVGKAFNAMNRWKHQETLPERLRSLMEPFDVMPALYRHWGMYAHLKRKENPTNGTAVPRVYEPESA